MKVKIVLESVDMRSLVPVADAHHGPMRVACNCVEVEQCESDPKDGELFLSRTKPEETLVEVRIGSDVQIDR